MDIREEYLKFYKINFGQGKYCSKSWGLASYKAGQQSKQAEIDTLKSKIDICEKLRNSQFDKLWNLTQAIERARVGADEDFDLFLNHLSNILKGE